jgi:hypothetical protein
MARTPLFVLITCLVTGCGHSDASQDKNKQAMNAAERQSQQQAAADPARQPHPGNANPLRRKLGDLQIRELFFGKSQTQGDWIAYLPCSQSYAGVPVAAANRIYLKRCPALQQFLLTRAHGAGFGDATVKDVMDVWISGAAVQTP